MFSLVTASLGRPLGASSSVLISPYLNFANHFSTVDFPGSEYCLSSQALASTVFFFVKKQCFIHTPNFFLSIAFKLIKVASHKIRYLTNY